jgi:transcription-repair coupling factor (superfamily II helicase)
MPLVEERGDFSARGGIVDLFSPGYARPLRLEFDGDRLESVREFSPASQRTERLQEDLLLLPMKEFSLRRSGLDEILRRLDQRAADLEMDRREKKSLLESLREGIPFPGMEFLVPYFYPELVSLFAYLPQDALVWLDGADRVEAEAEKFARLAWERHEKAKEERRLVPPLEAIYLNEHEWRAELAPFAQVHGESLSILASSERALKSTLTVESFLTSDVRHETHLQGRDPSLAPLVERLRGWEGERVLFIAPTRGDAARLRELLAHYDLEIPVLDQPAPLLSISRIKRAVMRGHLSEVSLPKPFNLVTLEKFSAQRSNRRVAKVIRAISHQLAAHWMISALDHGIGIYRGLKFLQVAGVEGEFLHLEYEAGDRLYLPVDRINVVQKYIGGDDAKPALDRLGGNAWERVKAKSRKAIFAMAEELVQLYALREARAGIAAAPPDTLYQEFEAAFEFEETPNSSAPSTTRWRACRQKSRWTVWSAATSVTVRPKSPCARRFSPSRAASRSPCWRRRRFSRSSICRPFAIASAIIRCASRWSAAS